MCYAFHHKDPFRQEGKELQKECKKQCCFNALVLVSGVIIRKKWKTPLCFTSVHLATRAERVLSLFPPCFSECSFLVPCVSTSSAFLFLFSTEQNAQSILLSTHLVFGRVLYEPWLSGSSAKQSSSEVRLSLSLTQDIQTSPFDSLPIFPHSLSFQCVKKAYHYLILLTLKYESKNLTWSQWTSSISSY